MSASDDINLYTHQLIQWNSKNIFRALKRLDEYSVPNT